MLAIGGVVDIAFDIAEIINKFDRKLFSQIIHPGHCLYHLLPPKTPAHCRYSLRERQHSFQLSNIEFLQFKNSFINRYLFVCMSVCVLSVFIYFFFLSVWVLLPFDGEIKMYIYLNLDDCILHYSAMCSLNFVHTVHIVHLILHFILCN